MAVAERCDVVTDGDGRRLSTTMISAYRSIDWMVEIMEEQFWPIEKQLTELSSYIQQVQVPGEDQAALQRWAQARVCEKVRRVGRISSGNGHFTVQRPRRIEGCSPQ